MDGFLICEGDCNDNDDLTFPGASEQCDGADNDCDGQIDEGLSTDVDGDGHSAPGSCALPNQDCDDADPGRFPANPEVCDGVDNDCANGVDDGLSVDADGDGHYLAGSCLGPADDCDDSDATAYPGNPELCDGLDNDCDGSVDEGLSTDADGDGHFLPGSCLGPADDCDDVNPTVSPSAPELCDALDNDCDGAPDDGLSADADGDGFWAPGSCLTPANDCDDLDAAVWPGAPELCDGVDNDCDGGVDEGLSTDADGDGHYQPGSCAGPADDCDDGAPTRHPGAPELCDQADNDCDGTVDEGLSVDADGDGFYAPGSCAGPATDCDDSSANAASVYPGAPELCDRVDNNCDGAIPPVEADSDGDGFSPCEGDCDDTVASAYPGGQEIPYNGVDDDCMGGDLSDVDGDGFDGGPGGSDCHDQRADVHPGASEGPGCDGIDGDCDGLVDDGLPCTDDDCDGFSEDQGDCNDGVPQVHPGMPESCDGIDNNCDGLVDDRTPCVDDDGDGFSEDQGDCNDGDPAAYPAAVEVCDGVDNDCDGAVDEDTPCHDGDGDGFSQDAGDCDDADPAVNPAAVETPDGLDQDCDGGVDEGTEAGDDDGDGYCEGIDLDGDGVDDCGDGALPGDCDDSSAATNPAATEVAGDGVDNDCDGVAEPGVRDGDGDGWADDLDCDPLDPTVHPGATELPDAVDQDCDGRIDEGTLAGDDDNDGYCEGFDLDGDGLPDCGDGSLPGDCDDTDPAVAPDASERANGRDDDCDGVVDEDTVYSDDDGDGYSEFGGDCDDADPESHPGATEVAGDDIDQDCNGEDLEPGTAVDADGDGFSTAFGDCDDQDAAVNPLAEELCGNRIDDDCDGRIDPSELCQLSVVGGGCNGAVARSAPAVRVPSLVLLWIAVVVARRRA
jgi:hypothetical protein